MMVADIYMCYHNLHNHINHRDLSYVRYDVTFTPHLQPLKYVEYNGLSLEQNHLITCKK